MLALNIVNEMQWAASENSCLKNSGYLIFSTWNGHLIETSRGPYKNFTNNNELLLLSWAHRISSFQQFSID